MGYCLLVAMHGIQLHAKQIHDYVQCYIWHWSFKYWL